MHLRERPSYPTFPASCWWPLRERLKRSLPPAITTEYLQAVLEVEPKTARNLVPMLRQMGIIDEAGAPRERANAWRVDAEYRHVCQSIRDEIYPAGLRHAIPDPAADFEAAVRWFMKAAGVGTAAAKRMARFYALLSKADPAEARDAGRGDRRQGQSSRRPDAGSRNGHHRPDTPVDLLADAAYRNGAASRSPADGGPPSRADRSGRSPDAAESRESGASQPGEPQGISLPIGLETGVPGQLVVQIQLPPGATPEQIDALVASIARHLAPLGLRR